MKVKSWILMGDIIYSRKTREKYGISPQKLQREMGEIIEEVNRLVKQDILSPYTVTLGDEFQGLAVSLGGAIRAIFAMEELKLKKGYLWQLRYVLNQGMIESRINIAYPYSMLGPGLTFARERLSKKGRQNRQRYQIFLDDDVLQRKLQLCFDVMEGLQREWRLDDPHYLHAMIEEEDDQAVAERFGKTRSSAWKTRRREHILEYTKVKELIIGELEEWENAG
jgi:hypothetical protein